MLQVDGPSSLTGNEFYRSLTELLFSAAVNVDVVTDDVFCQVLHVDQCAQHDHWNWN